MITAAVTKVSALLCPSESAIDQLYPVTDGHRHELRLLLRVELRRQLRRPGGDQPYTGTIIPGYDLDAG